MKYIYRLIRPSTELACLNLYSSKITDDIFNFDYNVRLGLQVKSGSNIINEK